jgi:hypothetical protein
MAKQHSKEFWFSYKVEGSNYASGDGVGAAGAMAKMTTSGTAFQKPLAKPKMPYVKWNREDLKSMGDDALATLVVPNGKEVIDGEVKSSLQISTWLDSIFLPTMASAAGSLPTNSYTFHWQHGLTAVGNARRFESYGCYVKKWKLEVNNEKAELPTQITTFTPYDTKTETGAGTNLTAYDRLAFLTTKPALNRDVTFTIAGAAVKFNKLMTEIERVMDTTIEAGSVSCLQPLIIEIKANIEVEFCDPQDVIACHELVEVDTAGITITIPIVFAAGTKTITMTNMRLGESDNADLPDKTELYKRRLKLVPNTGFTCTIA